MNYETYAARVRKMNPIDDDFLRKMAEDKSFCEEVIQTILEEPDFSVMDVKPQASIKNLQGRSVVLDIHCVDSQGKYLNVEVQKADGDDHQKRVRYNAACITANITDTGVKFEKVPDVCAIYITKNDFLKKGKTTYHVDRVIRETGEVVYNGFSEIYVNSVVKDGTPTSELMTIFTVNDAYDEKNFPATSRRKRYLKEDEKGVGEMCAIMQEIKEEGRTEGRIAMILEMYRDEEITLEHACKRLDLTEEEFLEETRKYGIC